MYEAVFTRQQLQTWRVRLATYNRDTEKYGHGSPRGPVTRMAVLAKASNILLDPTVRQIWQQCKSLRLDLYSDTFPVSKNYVKIFLSKFDIFF